MTETPTTTVSWAAEVIADSSGNYASNALRFATESEAQDYALDLAGRWSLVSAWRMVETQDPVNAARQDGRTIHFTTTPGGFR